jgi:hypothetical protein
MAEVPKNPLLRRFWFRRPVGFGYGVTAYSAADAAQLLERAALPADWVEVVEDVDVAALDMQHVLPNLCAITFREVWYPALNL